MSIGNKLKHIRLEQNLTLKELHKLTGISISFISDIENKRRNPSIDNLKILSKALNVDISYFLDDSAKPILNSKDIENSFPIVPDRFINAKDARDYVSKHQIYGYGGFTPSKMSDDEILEFANEMLNQIELLSIKYKKNKKK